MKRKLEELNLLDDFLFGTLISHPIYGERFANILIKSFLDREMNVLKIVPQMNYYGQDTDCHGVRLDVYIEEAEVSSRNGIEIRNIYDIEPSRINDNAEKESLPRRVRFYRSTIDVKNLESGHPYTHLKNVIIIMILPYDPFGFDRMVYTVKNRCMEEPEMEYDDGALNLFLYTKGKIGTASQELKELLYYLENTTWQNAVNNSLKEIQTMVDKIKYEENAIIVYNMKGLLHDQLIRNEGLEEGLATGRATLAKTIQDFLSDLGPIPENITTKIENETNLDTLRHWLKLAARTESLEEFAKQLS